MQCCLNSVYFSLLQCLKFLVWKMSLWSFSVSELASFNIYIMRYLPISTIKFFFCVLFFLQVFWVVGPVLSRGPFFFAFGCFRLHKLKLNFLSFQHSKPLEYFWQCKQPIFVVVLQTYWSLSIACATDLFIMVHSVGLLPFLIWINISIVPD